METTDIPVWDLRGKRKGRTSLRPQLSSPDESSETDMWNYGCPGNNVVSGAVHGICGVT